MDRRGGAAVLFLVVALVCTAPAVALAQSRAVQIGETVTMDPYSAAVVATTEATEFDDIPGDWLVADVVITATTDTISMNPVLDWQVRFPAGGYQYPFPTQELLDAPAELAKGESLSLTLGLTGAGIGAGPAELVYEPFAQDVVVGSWQVDVPGTSIGPEPVRDPSGEVDLVVAAPAGSGPEQIISFDAQYEIRRDGVVEVTETIEYDFGTATDRHGIYREVATRQRYSEDQDRRYRFSLGSVEADRGAPAGTDISEEGDLTRVRIGDPDVTITGAHTYTITYELEGTLNPQATLDELYWNVTGDRWPVQIADVTLTVTAPQGIGRVACFAGGVGSTDPCSSAAITDAGEASYSDDGLYAGHQLTIVAGFPKGSVKVGAPDLVEARKTAEDKVRDALEPGIGDVIGSTLLGVAGIGAASVLVVRRGRDLQAAGSAVDAVHDPAAGPVRRVGLLERVETPVEFEPPDGIRPGLVGTIYDEKADPLDVTATIVDLAVRGYLRIEEMEKEGWFAKTDHRLVKLREADDFLLTYERRLLNSLFRDSDEGERLLSDIKDTFASKLADVQESMYAEVVQRRWFEKRPDKTRNSWSGVGALVLSAGVALVVLGTIFSYPAWPGAALAVVGIVFLVTAGRMPRRTAQGTSVNRRVQGFRRFIVDSEVHRADFAERMNLFTEYLPYAIVFGAVDKWAKTFADLNGGEVPVGGWYIGTHPFNVGTFGSSMNSFSSAASTSMSSTPGGSGSSGFSGGGSAGGGGGGGGGGSW